MTDYFNIYTLIIWVRARRVKQICRASETLNTAPFDICTWHFYTTNGFSGSGGGGVVGGLWYLKRCLQPLTFSLLAIFRSIPNSLLAHFLRSSSLTIHHSTLCPPTLMISKFPTQTETSPQSRNLLTLTSLVLITDLTTMESREKVTIHLSKNKDSSDNNWRFKFEIQVSKM